MKILSAASVLFGAAILVLGASAGQASAATIYPWASCWDYCGGIGEYPYTGGCGYGACGCGYRCYGRLDYDRYVVGHGPMFPAGDNSTGFSYGAPITPRTPPGPKLSPEPNGQ
jgi:hypothetical protein